MIHLLKIKPTFVAVLAIALLPRYTLAAGEEMGFASFRTEPEQGWTIRTQRIAQLPPAPDTGTPEGQRTPGGSRPELSEACKETDKAVTALVPENGNGSTSAEHPVFWFYIPYAHNDPYFIEFSLLNRDETTTLYQTSLQLATTPGVIGIPLPPSPEHSLKPNQSYHWYLTINCGFQETAENDIVLDGWITRVQRSPNLDQFGVIWYDELTNLAKRYLLEPQNLEAKNAWTELLKSVGLEELAQAPLVGSLSNPQND